jgi:hypothetical protein
MFRWDFGYTFIINISVYWEKIYFFFLFNKIQFIHKSKFLYQLNAVVHFTVKFFNK